MKPGLKFCVFSISCLVIFNITLAGRSSTPRSNRNNNLKYLEEITVIETKLTTSRPTTSNTIEVPVHFPYGMACASGKFDNKIPENKVTEQCCHETGVPCKQTDHIGHPQERNCVTNHIQEWKNMRTCCRKKKQSFRKGHVEDGIDCNHRQENVTKTTEISIPIPEPTTTTKPQPKTTMHHHRPVTSRPQHQTLRPHIQLQSHRTTTITTTTTTTTTTKKSRKKHVRRLDKKFKTLKID